jgi:2-polyprenyl-3-methyl-5-hydroxy-6-metoxy-1,4-benzoquinol methylase
LPEISPQNIECRNCNSKQLESLFHFPNTFFWYGEENPFLEKNISPKYADAILLFCNSCGFIGAPVSERLRNQLNIYYRSPFSVPGATPGQDSEYSNSLAQSFFSSFSELEPDWIPKNVLEVGCQRGFLLNEFQKRGAKKVVGIEPGEVAPWVDDSGTVLDIRRGLLSREILKEQNFDLVYSLQVLEHVENPNKFLQIIFDSLKDGGRLFLAVPNEFYSLREGNVGMFLFQHLNYFTQEILQSLLNANGFNVTGLISSRHRELMVMAQKMPANWNANSYGPDINGLRILLTDYQRKVAEKLDYIRALLEKTKEKTLGFYGVAGTSNIFSWIPELKNNKVEVFDSDSNTWGKPFGGVPCLIQSPENLNYVDNIIPAPFRLHDEIAEYIEGRKVENLTVHRLY